jgi:hypothetical protein
VSLEFFLQLHALAALFRGMRPWYPPDRRLVGYSGGNKISTFARNRTPSFKYEK